MSALAINNLIAIETNPRSSFLENIAYKKVNNIALSCFESLVHWFLRTFSCCYPAYDSFYTGEVLELSLANTEQRGGPQASSPVNRAPSVAEIVSPMLSPRNGAPPIVQNLLPVREAPVSPKITNLGGKGQLLDYTGIAGVAINDDTFVNTADNQYITLKSPLTQEPIKVLMCGHPRLPESDSFHFQEDGWRVVARKVSNEPGKVELSLYCHCERINRKIVDTAKLYKRNYISERVGAKPLTGDVYITDEMLQDFPDYLKLVDEIPIALENQARVVAEVASPTPLPRNGESMIVQTIPPVKEMSVVPTPVIAAAPKIMNLATAGQLHDFTEGKIAGLKIWNSCEYLTLKSPIQQDYIIVLLAANIYSMDNSIDCESDSRVMAIQNVYGDPDKIKLECRNGQESIDTSIVDITKLYVRNVYDRDHLSAQEQLIYITDRMNVNSPGLRLYASRVDQADVAATV